MIDLYNALKFITMLFFIQKIVTFNLGVAFFKSASILINHTNIQLSGLSNRRQKCLKAFYRIILSTR